MTLPSRMELTSASDPHDPRNALDLGERECFECGQESGDLKAQWFGNGIAMLCPDCRWECLQCGKVWPKKSWTAGIVDDHECSALERREMSRPKIDPVDRAFDAYIALDMEGRTRLQERLNGYNAALSVMSEPKAAPKPRAPKAPKQEAVA